MVYAWPNAEIAVMSAQAAIDVLYKDCSEEGKERYREEYKKQFMTPFEAAHNGYVDEVIAPSDTRKNIINILSFYQEQEVDENKVPHKNIPM